MAQHGTRLLVLAVVALVALAGCSGGGGPAGEDTPTPTTTVTTTPTDGAGGDGGDSTSTPTDDGDDGNGDADDGNGDDDSDGGDSDDGSGDGTDDAPPLGDVALTGDYTAEFEMATTGFAEGGFEINGTVMVGSDGASYVLFQFGGDDVGVDSTEQYQTADGVVYVRNVFDGQAFVQRTTQPQIDPTLFGDPASAADDLLTGGAGNDDADERYEFRSVGVVDTANGERAKYVVDSLDQIDDAGDDDLEFRSVLIELYLTPDASELRELSYAATVYDAEADDEFEITLQVVYSDVGSTTVEEPDWTDEAVGRLAP